MFFLKTLCNNIKKCAVQIKLSLLLLDSPDLWCSDLFLWDDPLAVLGRFGAKWCAVSSYVALCLQVEEKPGMTGAAGGQTQQHCEGGTAKQLLYTLYRQKNGLYNWLPFSHIHVHFRASYTNTSDPLTFPLVPPSGHGFYFSNICCFFFWYDQIPAKLWVT